MDLDQADERKDNSQWICIQKRVMEIKNSFETPPPCKKKNKNHMSVSEITLKREEETQNTASETQDKMDQVDGDSQEDLFGDYDSFGDDSWLLAQLEDTERKHSVCTSSPKENDREKAVNCLSYKNSDKINCLQNAENETHKLLAEDVESNKHFSSKSNIETEHYCSKTSVLHDANMDEPDELPSSQLALMEEFNSPLVKHDFSGNRPVLNQRMQNLNVQNQSRITNSETHKQLSLKDQIKNAMAENAKSPIPHTSRSKQVKETVLSEEITVAMKTIEATSDIDMGPFYGLPSKVQDLIFQFKGIKKVYEWQHVCLTLKSVQERKNLIYSLPTSGGKTLVAEILIMQELLCRKRDALFILPYVAIVQEKIVLPRLSLEEQTELDAPFTEAEVREAMNSLHSNKSPGEDDFPSEFYKEFQDLLIPIFMQVLDQASQICTLPESFSMVRDLSAFGIECNFLVEEYAGSRGKFPPIKRRKKNCLYVATIEKAHSLVNSLIETERINSLGVVVVDEAPMMQPVHILPTLHMLGEGSRGAVLEMALSKILFMSKTTQIIGMSATLNNVSDLQRFLKAEHYSSNFRPVQLKEYVKIRDCIYEVDNKSEDCFTFARLLNYKYSSNMEKIDPDHIIALVTEVIPQHSCLLFCPTKKNCENVSKMLCKYLSKSFLSVKEKEKYALIQELKDIGNGAICPILQGTVPYGLAYHHSGLINDERKVIEQAYSSGILCLLTCTSTLAAGVNLPARRVILRSPYVAKDFLKRSQYKQMVGRAGRAGIDTEGESILIAQEHDKKLVADLISSPMESCYSNLIQGNEKGIKDLLLSLIGLKLAQTLGKIVEFMEGTLLGVQQQHHLKEKSLLEVIEQALQPLMDKGLIKGRITSGNENEKMRCQLEVTNLGHATYKGSIDLAYCDTLNMDLKKSLEGLVLNNYLHLIYLVTPYDMVSQCTPDWMIYFRQFHQLDVIEQNVFTTVGVSESFLTKKASGQAVKQTVNGFVIRRFYLSLVLYFLFKEMNLWAVAQRFNLPRGFMQNLLSSSAAFSSSVLHFCEELEEFWSYRALFADLIQKLSYCVKPELIPLMEVSGVLKARAQQLYNAGYKSLSHLANSSPETLVKTIEHMSRRQANQIVSSAKMLLNEKAEALLEELEELMRQPSNFP